MSRQLLLQTQAPAWRAALLALGLTILGGCQPIVSPLPGASPCATNNGGCDANATCSAQYGNPEAFCVCNPGFFGDGHTCTANPCTDNNGGCDSHATCSPNEDGSAHCACGEGYTGDGHTCSVVTDPCAVANGGCGPAEAGTCTAENNHAVCTCHAGYVLTAGTCVSKCELPEFRCGANTSCALEQDQVHCACLDGFVENTDGDCVADPCLMNNGNCGSPDFAHCDSSTGTAVCTCSTGYVLNGGTCVDACARGACPSNSTCGHALDQSIVCTCNANFLMVNGFCVPDPCAVNNGNCGSTAAAQCHSTDGIRACQCNPGYRTASDGSCEDPCANNNGGCGSHATCSVNLSNNNVVCACAPGYELNGSTCVADPCATNNGGCGSPSTAVCSSSSGIASCSCRSGYTSSRPGGPCVDVCNVNNGGCGDNSTCSHAPQSSVVQCACAPTYQQQGSICVKDPCLDNNGGCGSIAYATCSSSAGVASCTCGTGYTLSGRTCVDVCTINNGGCQANSTCGHSQTDNSIVCNCNGGYLANGNVCYVNECQTSANTCNQVSQDCVPHPGGHDCQCKDTFFLGANNVCQPLISSVAAGGNHLSCITKYDGKLYCSGNGQMGPLVSRNLSVVSSFAPVGNKSWRKISAGARYVCGLDSFGVLDCWHQPTSGAASSTPVVMALNQTWTDVSTSLSGDFGCAVRSDGTVWCWGDNALGQLGTNDHTSSTNPRQTGRGTEWTAVSVGEQHACALRADHTIWCWGDNTHGELGTGGASTAIETVVNSDLDWAAVSAGAGQTCALKADGSLWCWGCQGQNDACWPQSDRPTRFGTDTWSTISAGGTLAEGAFVCGVRTDGSAWCWGDDAHGQLGNGVATTAYRLTPPSPSAVTSSSSALWTGIRAGTGHACGSRDDGTLWCWGDNLKGELGDTTAGALMELDPVQVPGSDWQSVVQTGTSTACALKTDDSLWCWGDNPSTIGDGNEADQSTPEREASSSNWSAAATGGGSCAIASADRTLFCWGPNTWGELGSGDSPGFGGTSTPVAISGDKDWTEVCTGARHACALKSGGTLWCWGDDGSGQLGFPVQATATSPTQVNGETDWASLACGELHTCAVKTDGTLWCWGSNTAGQIGTASGLFSFVKVPTRVGASSNWANVAAGTAMTCAIPTDHSLWCWGSNTSGQLGQGNTTGFSSATLRVGSANTWMSLSASGANTCAIQSNQSLWCWGSNTGSGGSGMLGSGDTAGEPSPIQVAGSGWNSVAVGAGQTCATRANNTLWCWGSNTSGQLGNGAAARTRAVNSL